MANEKSEKITSYLNKVFLGDVLELLKELPDKSVEMVYGDPDYNVGVKYGDKSYTKTFDEYTLSGTLSWRGSRCGF